MKLGATVSGDGVEFGLYSSVADAVEVCVFDDSDAETRHALEQQEGFVWTGHVPAIRAGTRYGFRVHGPHDPGRGLYCDPERLLIDPYSHAIDSEPLRSVVVDSGFDWGDDAPLDRPLAETVVYELHVKGFTKLHPGVPEELRGTYAGLAHPAAIEHLQRVGVSAVELLPIHQFVHDAPLVARGLRNYWGYQSIGFFAPHDEYASGDPVDEFKAMVKALHAAGIEVILDVVYNHTAEGGAGGPTLSFRGIDNPAYYRLTDAGEYVDETGCGNTVDSHQPAALRLIMDSLRYWREEMHVDGFRFDLAAALGRGADDFDPHAAFLQAVGQDPVLGEVKLIAEPWDIGAYEVGDFPPGWSEWNGRFRDTVRDYWRGTAGTLPDLATRVAGSADLYGDDGRRPTASVNLVTVHDGFTLRDLVSYDGKHNEANGEDNRDGTDDNRSWNCGVEGPTDDPDVVALRARQQRNLLATLLLARGVPLLLAGDELGRTQGGNNNAYCQDNETSWVDWSHVDDDLVGFVAGLCRLRRAHPAFSRTWRGGDDLVWFRPDGAPMGPDDWSHDYSRAVTVTIRGEDGSVAAVLMLNSWWEPLEFALPEPAAGGDWTVAADTAGDQPAGDVATRTLAGRSLVLLT